MKKIFIKKDNDFNLVYTPAKAGEVDLGDSIYINKITGNEVTGVIEIFEFKYTFQGERLDKPFFTPTNIFVPKEDYYE